MLKLAYDASPVIMESCFGSSYLSDLYPDVTINEETVNKLVSELGSERRAEMTHFMRSFYPNNPAVLIDGTDIFTRCYGFPGGMSFFSEPEPDERMRFLCIFSDINHAPVFSRAVPYDLTDMSVIAETIESADLRKCTIFVDEDFYSDKNMAFLKENHLKFIMQLYSSTKLIPKKSPDKQKWDGRLAFTWGRDIMHRKIAYRKKKYDKFGNYLYLFFDYTDYDEDDPDWQLYSEEDCLLAFISSQNVDAKKIYTAYREKKEIEECYRYMGSAADIETLYKASNIYGWEQGQTLLFRGYRK